MKKLIFVITFLAAALFFAAPTFAYTVQQGDTMTKIARENGVTLKELADSNPQIRNLNLIFIGQKINIPDIMDSTETKVKSSSYSLNKELDISLTEDELDLLARIVRAEAQTESFEGKVAVADVVLNRLESPLFPNTVKEVIYQPRQFQPVANGQVNRPADQESIEAVQAALSDMRNISQDSLFFYNPRIATCRWLDSRETTVVIGQHVFKN